MVSINPETKQIEKAIATIPKGVPVVMLNLLNFKDKAYYPDHKIGHMPDNNQEISGRQAYAIYSEKALKHLSSVGGEVIWFGTAKASIIAPPGENWDQIFLVRYPSIDKFIEMITRKSYQEIVIHRTAALKDSRLIATIET